MNITINQVLRPVKLAFLIQPNRKASYVRALQVCSSLWGGKHFPILPYYKKFSEQYTTEYHIFATKTPEYYKNILDNFDPDFIVIDKGIDPAQIKTFKPNREIINIEEIEESIANNEAKYGISIHEVLETIKDVEFKHERTDALKVCCPSIPYRDTFAMTMCGSVPEQYWELLKKVDLPEKYISFPKINNDSLDACIGKDIVNYLSLTTYNTDAFGSPLWTGGFAIYILDKNHMNDLLNIWNYRALGWKILAIPHDLLDTPYYRTKIEEQQREYHEYPKLLERIQVLVSHALTDEKAREHVALISTIQVDKEKRAPYIHQWWFPRYWEKGEFLSYDKSAAVAIRSTNKQTIIATEDLKIHIPVLSPTFKERYIRHIKPRYINEIRLDFDEMEGKYAQVLPDIPTRAADFIIKGSGFSQWIFSEGAMYFLAQGNSDYLSFIIPKASEVFTKWFENHKLKIRHSSSGKLGNQLLKNIGGIYGTNFFANRGMPPVLALFENGKTVLKQTLEGLLSRQLKNFRETSRKSITAKLLDKSIIEFGTEIQCSFCDQRSFYRLSLLHDKVKCPICQNDFYVPAHDADQIKWAYKGMGPFSRNNKADGLFCVLLTLRFFRVSMYPSLITPFLSFEILENDKVINEVDLGVFFCKDSRSYEAPDLFFAECKTEIDFKDDDIEKMKNLGIRFPGTILTFATLKLELSEEEKIKIARVANYFRKGLGRRPVCPVLILTGNELLPEHTFEPLLNIKPLIIDHLRFSDEISHLADVTCQKYLGLPSFGSIVEKKLDVQRKKWEEKQKNKVGPESEIQS